MSTVDTVRDLKARSLLPSNTVRPPARATLAQWAEVESTTDTFPHLPRGVRFRLELWEATLSGGTRPARFLVSYFGDGDRWPCICGERFTGRRLDLAVEGYTSSVRLFRAAAALGELRIVHVDDPEQAVAS